MYKYEIKNIILMFWNLERNTSGLRVTCLTVSVCESRMLAHHRIRVSPCPARDHAFIDKQLLLHSTAYTCNLS